MKEEFIEDGHVPEWTRSLIAHAVSHRKLNRMPGLDYSILHHCSTKEFMLVLTCGDDIEFAEYGFAAYYRPTKLLLSSFSSSTPDDLRCAHDFEELCSAYVDGYVTQEDNAKYLVLRYAEASVAAEYELLQAEIESARFTSTAISPRQATQQKGY